MKAEDELNKILALSKEAKKEYDSSNFDSALQKFLNVAEQFINYYSKATPPIQILTDSPIGKIVAHSNLATCYFAIGNCFKNLKQYEHALRYLHATLLIQLNTDCSLPLSKVEQRIIDTEILRPDTPLQIKFDQHWINVPQGRTCRLISRVNDMQYAGLYSDRFVSCVMIIVKSESRMSMTHLDHLADKQNAHLEHILDECTWVSSPHNSCEVTIIYKAIGELIKKPVYDLLTFVNNKQDSNFYKKILLLQQKVDDETFVVKCSFSRGITTNKSKIRPLNLLRHPNDYRMHVCRQIDQALYLSNQTSPPITRGIFDGRCWINIDENELIPAQFTQDSRDFLQSCLPSDPYIAAANKVYNFVLSAQKKNSRTLMLESVKTFTTTATQFICLYSSKFDYRRILIQNILELITLYEKDPKITLTPGNKKLFNNIKEIVTAPNFILEELLNIIGNFSDSNEQILKEFIEGTKELLKQYYHAKTELCSTPPPAVIKEKSETYNQRAQTAFLEKNYQAAFRLYSKGFVYLAHHITRDNITLIDTVEKMGNCLMLLKEYGRAAELFTMAITLAKISHSGNQALLNRLDNKLQDCAQKSNLIVPNLADYTAKTHKK